MNHKDTTKGFLALLASGLILGSFGVLVRLLNVNLSAYQQILFRNLIALVFALLFFYLRKTNAAQKVEKKYIFLYGITFPISVIFYTLSILLTTIALTIFALYIGSIIGSFVIGIFVFKEKINWVKLTSMAFVLIALLFLTFPVSKNNFNLGLLFGLLSGIIETIGNAFRKHLGGKVDRFLLVAIAMVGGVVISGTLMVLNHQSLLFLPHISMLSWTIGLIFGILIVAMSYFSIVGFQYFDLGLGTLVRSSELLFAILFGLIFFKEYPHIKEIIGGLFIIAAIVISNIGIGATKEALAPQN